MGIGFVLVFGLVVGVIVASIAAFVFRRATSWLTRRNDDILCNSARERAIKTASFLPFVCLAWAGAVFVFQGFINTTVLHRDIGVGDAAYCPLPNGYSILLIDVPDQGTVYNPKTQRTETGVGDQEDAMSGVRELQVAGAILLGGSDSQYSKHFGQNSPPLDRYFLLDTRSGRRADFVNEDALRIVATKMGITLKLEPIYEVYRRYRYTWFDLATAFLLILPPLIAAALWLRSIARLRRKHHSSFKGGFAGPAK